MSFDSNSNSDFEPKIVAFCCNFCSYEGADRAGALKKEYPASIRIIRTMCSGRVEPEFVIYALKEGADGVLILGCHPGDCHFKVGNYKVRRRYYLLRSLLTQFGLEPERVRLDWVAASEGDRFAQIATEFTETIKALGPSIVSPVEEVEVAKVGAERLELIEYELQELDRIKEQLRELTERLEERKRGIAGGGAGAGL